MQDTDWEAPPDPPRRWPLAAGLVTAVLAAGVLARFGLHDPGEDAFPVVGDTPAATPAEETREPGPTPEAAGGEWVEFEAAPIQVPGTHLGVWSGRELIVGFQPEVAAYDPAAATWRSLPDVPGPERIDPAPVWTGEEILLFGGMTPDGTQPHRDGGLRLDPDDGEWEPIPPPPVAPLWDPTVVWTGQELIVWGGARPGDAHDLGEWPVRGAAYRPDEERWRTLSAAPIEQVYFSDGVWTGSEVLVWGTHHPPGEELRTEAGPPFAAAYDPAADAWRSLPAPPMDNPAEAGAVWTGQQVILWGRPPWWPGDDEAVISAALDPDEADRGFWRLLPPADITDELVSVYGVAAAWIGDAAIFYGGYPRSVGLVYRPERGGRWQHLPRHRARLNAVAAWTGAALLLWGGYTPTGPDVDLWAYCPADTTSTPCRSGDTAAPQTPQGTREEARIPHLRPVQQ